MFQHIFSEIQKGNPACFRKEIETDTGESITIERRFLPPQRLILLGGGHIAKPLCEMATKVEYEVVVVDDRPSFANNLRFPEAKITLCGDFPTIIKDLEITAYDYVAVITRGHKNDAECIKTILEGTFPFYLGLIGSKRRVKGLFEALEKEGYSKTLLEQIHTPIGLEIGAITPEEIAVSIVAELIKCRRRNMFAGEKGNYLIQGNTDMHLLSYLANPEKESAYCIVIDTKGSTPVKSGAMMAVDSMGTIYGTVGGGCGEHVVMRKALEVIQTKKPQVVCVDMTKDAATIEEEGMVCGGIMQVFIDIV